MAHVPRREELAFFDVHRQALFADVVDKVGLAAEEGGGLQHVHHRCDFVERGVFVHVGNHRHADFGFDFGEDAQAFGDAGAAVTRAGGAVGLVKRGFVDEGQAEAVGQFFQGFGGGERQRFGFNHAGPGDEEEGAVVADFKAAEVHAVAPSWRVRQARMKDSKSG